MNTQWKGRDCNIPLCQVSRINRAKDRHCSCIVEHKMSCNKFVGCSKLPDRAHSVLPNEMKKFVPTRGQQQHKRVEQHENVQRLREWSREVARGVSREVMAPETVADHGTVHDFWLENYLERYQPLEEQEDKEVVLLLVIWLDLHGIKLLCQYYLIYLNHLNLF